MKRELLDVEKKMIVALVVEVAVTVVMMSHVYTFGGKFYLQRNGGPIGLRSTACLAAMMMKLWDLAWTKLMNREGLEWFEYFRYVDDNRTFLWCLCEGWFWDGAEFSYSEERKAADLDSGVSDVKRTTDEVVKAMSSLVSFLQFEGEHQEMFADCKLPTLDTSLWVDGLTVNYQFFEKPMCPNRVIQKDSALSEDCMRASLTQEVVRRLLHCSTSLPVRIAQEALSKFAQKMVNSNHSIASTRIVLVHGTTKYLDMLRRSKLDSSDTSFKPLHLEKHYKRYERRLSKFLAKSGWYDQDNPVVKKTSWRHQLPKCWRGSRPVQQKVHDMNFSTVMQVPSTSGGRLLSALAKIEPRVAKSTGYQCKLTEMSGKPLSKMFSTNLSNGKCFLEDCVVCKNPNLKGSSLCQVTDVVYESICVECDAEFKRSPGSIHNGKYVGESYRTLYERSREHLQDLNRYDPKSHMMKHWALCHPNSDSPPLFTFKVIKKHNDPLSRKIHEAVRINECASLNSKSEWGHYKISRLTIEKSEWERRKEVEQEEKEDIALSEVIRVIKDRVNRLPATNRSNFYRKRPFNMSSGADDAKSPCQSQAQVSVPAKRVRSEENQPKPLIMTGEGPWNPSKSKYVGKGKKPVKDASVKSDSGVKRWLRNLGAENLDPSKAIA